MSSVSRFQSAVQNTGYGKETNCSTIAMDTIKDNTEWKCVNFTVTTDG